MFIENKQPNKEEKKKQNNFLTQLQTQQRLWDPLLFSKGELLSQSYE